MKTLSEIKEEIAKQEGLENWEHLLIEVSYSNVSLDSVISSVAKRYAEQALDEAADKARDYSLEVDKFGIKQSILSIKEQLK